MEEPSLKNLTSDFGKPKPANELLQNLGKPHIDSFNYFVYKGLQKAVESLYPVEFMILNGTNIKLKLESVFIHPPLIPSGSIGIRNPKVYPSECRQRSVTYGGKLEICLHWFLDNKMQQPIVKEIGNIPIMIKSDLCNLKNLSPEELIKCGEHPDEWGGYFVIKGKERIARILLNTRRNYPIAMKRTAMKKKDVDFSDTGIFIRCISEDHTTIANVLHFLINGTAKLSITYGRSVYYTPILLIMRCLVSYSDKFIFQHLISGFDNSSYYKGCILEMLRLLHENDIHNQKDAVRYVGKIFRVKVNELPASATDEAVCEFILKKSVLIHLSDNFDKFQLLVVMLQKLFSVIEGYSIIENADSIMMQEVLLGGHLYLKILKEKLTTFLHTIKMNILKVDKSGFVLTDGELLNAIRKSEFLESMLETFFATGNLMTNTGLGLQQDKGLTILVENISRMRYMSHFRAVHRGAIFEEMRITEPRQLLPDAWGFICPVHTPDGTPCGLLNHLSRKCLITDAVDKDILNTLPSVLVAFGMRPISTSPLPQDFYKSYIVMLDGRIIGHIMEPMIKSIVQKLRFLKIRGTKVPDTLEIILLEKNDDGMLTQFPGLYLYAGNARMMRPVVNIAAGAIELIGTFEQVYLDISITLEEAIPGITTHYEVEKSDFLSYVASLIPMPEYNQSPRNMYQCQMGKQSMGTACHNWQLQCSTKLYRLQTPASPLFRPLYYDLLSMDDYPMGLNAIIAVISYTGYDMEDAMIINKASLERGFAHGFIYRTETIELKPNCYFAIDPNKEESEKFIDSDGLPRIGSKIECDQSYYCYFDGQIQAYSVGKYTGKEELIVDSVKLCGDFPTTGKLTPPVKAAITFRIKRNPTVGDKFASRAGQKGIFSNHWKMEDLPFTESGMVPDIVFNPHGFPSRMTIAMMIECLAGKSAAINGHVYDASPFLYSEENTAINYFGDLLEKSGYNYYGTERMYNGVDGTEMDASIFFGIVHYQRLRHMVSDKWQVRSTGPVDIITRQPVRGRKRGGGGRVGEMERDSLISHGTPYILLDRFVDCSDKSTAMICLKCKSLVGPITALEQIDEHNKKNNTYCRICDSKEIQEIGVPYILRYLVAELASVNINLKFHTEE